MSITSDLIRGHIDTIILSYLSMRDSYGYDINKAIVSNTHGRYELKEATLYTALRRLEQSGLITSYWGDESVGARRRYYGLTPAGRSAHTRLKAEWDEAKTLIDQLIHLEGSYGK